MIWLRFAIVAAIALAPLLVPTRDLRPKWRDPCRRPSPSR